MCLLFGENKPTVTIISEVCYSSIISYRIYDNSLMQPLDLPIVDYFIDRSFYNFRFANIRKTKRKKTAKSPRFARHIFTNAFPTEKCKK